jgi:hypothetical protein
VTHSAEIHEVSVQVGQDKRAEATLSMCAAMLEQTTMCLEPGCRFGGGAGVLDSGVVLALECCRVTAMSFPKGLGDTKHAM